MEVPLVMVGVGVYNDGIEGRRRHGPAGVVRWITRTRICL
jgi:hypothetical protein